MVFPKHATAYGDDWHGPRFLRQAKHRRLLLDMTGQLADLVHLRIPLSKGLSAMAVDAPDHKVHTLLAVMALDVQNGLSLHEALARRPNFFPPAYVDTIRMGEETGRLGNVLDRLEKHLLRTGQFHDELAGHLFYLTAIFSATLLFGAGLLVFVIPQFAEIFGSFGTALPLESQRLVWVAYRRDAIVPIIVLLFLFLVYSKRRLPVLSQQQSWFGVMLWRVMMYIPYIGRLYRARDLGHVAQQLQNLTWAGLPLDKALSDVAASNVSPLMSSALTRMSARVRNGLSFAEAFNGEKESLFPHTFRGLVDLGDRAGELSETLGQLAQRYESETLNRAKLLLRVGAPLGVCFVGAYVFLVCQGFFAPIAGLSSLVIR